MSAKQMGNWALVFLLFTVACIVFELLDVAWFSIAVSTIFNISSAIKEDLELIKEKTKPPKQ